MNRNSVLGSVALASVALALLPAIASQSEQVVASYATTLTGRTPNQRHNALLALRRLDNATILPGKTFSFNRRVGTFSYDQGYRKAPVSYDGELIDDWGGGVCQASTTLYNAALLAGMSIVERHRHEFAPGYVEPGRDAAVAYSSIDLRFKNPYTFPVRLHAAIDGDCVVVEFIADRTLPAKPSIVADVVRVDPARTFIVSKGHGPMKVRTSGKPGCEVVVERRWGDRVEEISHDTYPVLNRVLGE